MCLCSGEIYVKEIKMDHVFLIFNNLSILNACVIQLKMENLPFMVNLLDLSDVI